jgi:hypothetical protein
MVMCIQTMRFNKMHLLVFFVFLAISVFSLRSFFATGDPVAFHDFTPIYKLDQLFRPYDFPWDYKSNLGSPIMLTGNDVYSLPFIGLSIVFGSVAFAGKVLMVLLMALSGFGFYLAFTYLLNSKTAGFIAGLYLIFNPFTLTRWQFGHNTVLLAYMFLPFAVLFFFKMMKEGGRISMFICGLLTALMIYTSPQVAYMFILFALLYILFDLVFSGKAGLTRRIAVRAVQGSLILVVAVVAAFPFFYQLMMVNIQVYSTRAEEAALNVSPMDFSGSTIPQVILVAFMISAFMLLWWKSGLTKLYRWWKSSGLTEDSSSFLIKAGRQYILFFAVLGLFSVLVIFSVVAPLTPIYYWLFNNVPGFGMFREVVKFSMLSVFSVAFFLAIVADGLRHYVAKAKISVHLRKALPILLISLIVFASSWQFLTGDVAGSVGTNEVPAPYKELDSWLSSQKGDFRIAFFPPATWATNYTWASREFLNPYVALQAKPTVEVKSEQDLTKSASLVRWVYTALYSNRTDNWGKLLSILGVKYVILQTDANMPAERADLAAFSMANTITAWGSQSDLQLEKNLTSIIIYENPHQLPHIYQTNGLSLIVGDRRTLLSLSNLDFDFSQNPCAFLDDNIGSTASLIKDAHYIFFQGDPFWSMLVSSLGENYIVKSWDYAPVSANPIDKWVSGDLMWVQDHRDLHVAPDGYIYTEGVQNITIPLGIVNSGNYRVLAQVYDGLQDSQGVSFTIDNSVNYVFKPTISTDGVYKWVEIGDLPLNSKSELQISSLGGPAAISKIAVVPESSVNEAAQNVSKRLQGSAAQVVYLFDDCVWNYNHTATIVNPKANDGRLVSLSNSSVQTEFYVFNDDSYTLNLQFQSPAEDATAKVHVDSLVKDLKLTKGASGFSTEVRIGPLDLSQGYHNITIVAETGNANFSAATLTNNVNSTGTQFQNAAGSEVPSYIMQSGSEYTVNATASYLAFLEAGNGYWELRGQNGAAAPICIFNFASLFPIDKPGSQYTLTYLGLQYIGQGFLVAIIGTVLLGLVIKFLYPKRLVKWKPEH